MRNPPPFDPSLFLTLANELSASGAEERHFRTAVGRAYYTVFLIARDKLRVTATQNVHTEVIVALRLRRQAWADQLDRLRRIRVAADYQLVPVDPSRRDWARNWSDSVALVRRLMPIVQAGACQQE